MRKDKKWLREEVKKLHSVTISPLISGKVKIDEVSDLIDQLEEPKKAILPAFAADIIRDGKATGKNFSNIIGNSSIRHWLIQKVDGKWKYFPEREEELMRAWVNGIEEVAE